MRPTVRLAVLIALVFLQYVNPKAAWDGGMCYAGQAEAPTAGPAAPKSAADRATDQDEAIARLKQRGGLVEIHDGSAAVLLAGKAATNAALDDLKKIADVVELAVCGPKVTDAGVAHLKELNRLERLDLQYTRITDKGLASISGLAQLKELNLDGSFYVTDAGLRQLKSLKSLESLDVTLTQTTDRGMDELRRALPKVQIHKVTVHTPGSNEGAGYG